MRLLRLHSELEQLKQENERLKAELQEKTNLIERRKSEELREMEENRRKWSDFWAYDGNPQS